MVKLLNKEKYSKVDKRKLPKRQMTVANLNQIGNSIDIIDSVQLPLILKQAFKLKIILISVLNNIASQRFSNYN